MKTKIKADMARISNLETTLIKAAKELVIEHGLEGLNARAIAKRAGCATGSLYNYFRSMSELILVINSETLMALKKEFERAVEIKTREVLSRSISRVYLSYVRTHLPFWRLLYEYTLPQGELLPNWYQKIIEDIFLIIEQALKPYLPKDSREATLAVRMLWAGMHGILILEMTSKLDIAHRESAEALCDSLFDHYLKD